MWTQLVWRQWVDLRKEKSRKTHGSYPHVRSSDWIWLNDTQSWKKPNFVIVSKKIKKVLSNLQDPHDQSWPQIRQTLTCHPSCLSTAIFSINFSRVKPLGASTGSPYLRHWPSSKPRRPPTLNPGPRGQPRIDKCLVDQQKTSPKTSCHITLVLPHPRDIP